MTETPAQKPGCLTAFLRLLRRPSPSVPWPDVVTEEELPYRLRDDFLTPAELSYYRVLTSVIGPRATVCAKVRLTDILFVARPHENRAYFNRIAQRHIDFLLCESSTMRPVLAIELDDSTHDRPDRIESDAFLDEALQAAGLPILRVIPKPAYTHDEVVAALRPLLPSDSPTEGVPEPPPSSSPADGVAPDCPKCGIPMVLRTATRGPQKGRQFYGCRNYPECRQVIPLSSSRAAG
jgi:hypothetical protein